MARGDASARLRELETAPKPWPRWAVSAAWGLLAASVCVLVGGGPTAVAVAFASSVAVDRLGRVLSRRGVPGFFLTFVGAAVASVVAVLAVRVGLLHRGDAAPVVAGAIVALLPGRAIVSAVEDAIAGFVVTASGRVLTVLFNAAAIVGGVGLGLGVARRLDLTLSVDAAGTSALDVVTRALAAGVAALATSVANRGRVSHLLPVAVTGVGASWWSTCCARSVWPAPPWPPPARLRSRARWPG
nr:threonine/serine exporter family protein [Angustibacter aerolatus]